MEEVERVKKRREEREYEKRRRHEERELLEREHAGSEFQDWQKKEEEFLFNQSKIRSVIRVRQGRTKPIDVLSLYIGKVLDGSSEHDPILRQSNVKDETEAEEGSFSPQLFCGDSSKKEAIDPEDDGASLERTRMVVIEERKNKNQEPTVAMEEGDVMFGSGAEVNLDSQAEWSHDKFRPRRPKYFNAVHTVYEWNKYNRTHYDHENPPPTVVRGYKFNIFYPDLINKTETPTYTRESDGSNGETCIIRFHAGLPYEDIAFKIVDKEWETSHKKGFKSTFDGGILRLHFNFRRFIYRR